MIVCHAGDRKPVGDLDYAASVKTSVKSDELSGLNQHLNVC